MNTVPNANCNLKALLQGNVLERGVAITKTTTPDAPTAATTTISKTP